METNINNSETNELLIKAVENVKKQQFNEAIALYESALHQNQTLYGAYFKLGAVHESMLNPEKAKEVYIKGIEVAKYYQNKPVVIDLSYTLLGLME